MQKMAGVSHYEDTEFNVNLWSQEPITEADVEQRFFDFFSAFSQRYQGDRDLDWLEQNAITREFLTIGYSESYPILQLFLQFAKLIYYIDARTRSMREIVRLIQEYQDEVREILPSISERLRPYFHDMHLLIEYRRDQLQRTRRNSASSDDSSEYDSD